MSMKRKRNHGDAAAARPSRVRTPEFAGATAIARRLGLSPSHVWRVATGRRRSLRLERELAACGAAREGGK